MIDLETYRARIGTFLSRHRNKVKAAQRFSKKVAVAVLFLIVIQAALFMSGNVELNPGPLTGGLVSILKPINKSGNKCIDSASQNQVSTLSAAKKGRRNCAMINCNSMSHRGILKSWYSKKCLIHGVYNGTQCCTCPAPIQFFPFPSKETNLQGYSQWIRLVSRKGWKPNKYSRICSKHFVEGKPTVLNPLPTENVGHCNVPHFALGKSRCIKQRHRNLPVSDNCQLSLNDDHSYGYTSGTLCPNCSKLIEKVKILESKLQRYEELYNQCIRKPFSVSSFLSNRKINVYTGIKDLFTFEFLFSKIYQRSKLMRHWPGPGRFLPGDKLKRKYLKGKKPGVKRMLSLKDEFFISLMRLKTGSSCELIGDMFGVSKTVVSRICISWWNFLADELSPLIYTPSQAATKLSLPHTFKRNMFYHVRHIIDCTEFFIQTPTSLKMKHQFWSPYKNHYTGKILVSIAPNGHFNFVSKMWVGRVSDGQITRNSKFLDEVEAGDVVLADKGFLVHDEIAMKNAKLITPPGLCGAKQMAQEDVLATETIAKRRIHVEQAIGRLKSFGILSKEFPISMLPQIDVIITVCAALCNLMGPIPKE